MAELVPRSIVWLRRDLRLRDHAALSRALDESARVVCAFVLDPPLLRGDRVGAPIVQFFFESLAEVRTNLRDRGSDLVLLEGDAAGELGAFAARIDARALYYNEDYEPQAMRRDDAVRRALESAGVRVVASTDHVVFAPGDVVQAGGKPYTVFTPFKRRWLERLAAEPRPPLRTLTPLARKLLPARELPAPREIPSIAEYGLAACDGPPGGEARALRLLDTFVARDLGEYEARRNFPALAATSLLSPHLRAGTIGVRTCLGAALSAVTGATPKRRLGIDTWIGELIWRDFYAQILKHFPHVADGPFVREAERLRWRDAPEEFSAWCEGRTGFPIVDAAMRQLNTTGWMHNRLRMIVASFLTKDLLIDYRRGERYFERHLADADLAANNGGWQWSSSTGTDAAPYFRIFNPSLQSEKFDPDGAFIRRMVPELAALPTRYLHAPWTLPPLLAAEYRLRIPGDYPAPIVDHAYARDRALAAFKPVFGKATP